MKSLALAGIILVSMIVASGFTWLGIVWYQNSNQPVQTEQARTTTIPECPIAWSNEINLEGPNQMGSAFANKTGVYIQINYQQWGKIRGLSINNLSSFSYNRTWAVNESVSYVPSPWLAGETCIPPAIPHLTVIYWVKMLGGS